ncbi:putative transcriptional regulatory protein [Colletotrichum sp. SAR 10_70]|nr:putative transcriptional regulatory protein [Colletotrichum sp. SAR 10_71]KAI8183943.1 putative transcriptional regulatory protein [Colletotrichum sp. SAR 10_75]KAI8201417.1 putative transcriptional regulatory protein [Colletotrichum sp. SAR 10_70]KAI8214630.1 putative transcriptional regulatory protein [Colletotrichum sp. SAR 10_76]KAI8235267.1 putative transcriptional regulatory protein [Colletotrichum sp. SAR 10_77]KAJ5006372.1 putative transcriptional regulatory protein [Colletotrichum 
MDLDEDAKPNLMALDMSANASVRSDSLNAFDHPDMQQQQQGPKAPIKRRAPIACRSVFPQRGQPDLDREYRHPRLRAEKAAKREADKARRSAASDGVPRGPGAPVARKPADEWALLPPLPEIIDAVHVFTSKYFQLGFIPKELLPQQLHRDHRSVSVFLVLGILSVSARFSPTLTERYGGEMKAVDFFMERASSLALNELYQEPTLERCQAFYLLSLAQQGSGWRNRSYVNIGIATRMAVLMHLHREEFYKMKNPTREMIIRAESARRTLWMLHSQDNLHCGALSPVSLAANDITALLPSNEDDFANGREPYSRAALEDTPPARDNPSLIHQPSRSLFASLIQAHYYWGKVARRAMATMKSANPWDPTSEYAIMAKQLMNWEHQLPADHRWSMVLLKGHKTVGEDLAYLGVTMITKLCNIVLRRAYLDNIIKTDEKDTQRRSFFSQMSDDLFRNVRELYEQVDAQFSVRSSEEGVGAQMASFCVYSCGLFSTYMVKYKNICSDKSIVAQAPNMLQRCMSILIESKQTWPLASRWLESLERFSRDPKAAAYSSMADGHQMQQQQQLPPELQQHFSPTMYAQAPPPYSPNNGMGMLVQAAFDTTNPIGSPGYDPNVAVFYSSPGSASITLGPGTDGFECELQSWFDGTAPVQATSWIGNGAAGLGWFGSN